MTPDVLAIDPEHAARTIEAELRIAVLENLHRRGAVIGVSGGVDSAVCVALAARALGPRRVLGVLMPERDSSERSTRLGRLVAEAFAVDFVVEDVTRALEGFGCYERQTRAIRQVFPEYGEGWRCKVTLPSLLGDDRLSVSRLTVESPSGEVMTKRMPPRAYLELVAATNFKQRARKTMEHHHADRLGFAVIGTPNRLEYDQGFFVKQGDGAADVKPIAHLYKTQVYALAEHLGVPAEVRAQPPTTDTYSMPQSQEEFYFALPYKEMDLALWARNNGVSAEELARALRITTHQAERVYKDIEAKRKAARYLRAAPLTVEAI